MRTPWLNSMARTSMNTWIRARVNSRTGARSFLILAAMKCGIFLSGMRFSGSTNITSTGCAWTLWLRCFTSIIRESRANGSRMFTAAARTSTESFSLYVSTKFANLRMFLAWMYGHPGKKLLFMGGEFGQSNEWNHDTSLDWQLVSLPRHDGLRRLVQHLNYIYKSEPALWQLDDSYEGFDWIDLHD